MRSLLAFVAFSVFCASVLAQSKPSGSGSSSGSSRPMSSGGSSGSKPESSKPKFSAPDSPKPKFSAPEPSKNDSPKPKFSAPETSSKPDDSKPKNNSFVSDKAQANKENRSERKYQESVKATAPPKEKYVDKNGKEITINKNDTNINVIREKPSNVVLQPQARQQTTVVHINNYHYPHDYGWYHSQPTFYIGGGYSSAFWWMMMDWSAERRAMWLYNNQANISAEAYQRGLQDGEVRARLAKLEAQNHVRNSNYIDPEFKNNPEIMYDQEYLEAAYNPNIHVENHPHDGEGGTSAFAIVFLTIFGIAFLFVLYLLIFKCRIGT